MFQVYLKKEVLMKIQEVSRLLNIPRPTLRYYEEKKLISSIPRKGNQRVYDDSHIEQIKFIQCMKQTGMKLADIHRYIELYRQGGKNAQEERIQILEEQKDIVAQKIQALQESMDYLNRKIDFVKKEKH